MIMGFRSRWLLYLSSLILLPVTMQAADRHVFLDRNGDGQLDDCPNPAHNAGGANATPGLQWCEGGTSDGRIVGTATGRVSASTCQSGGGTVGPVTSGTRADVDGDGTLESLYAHPQACVFNMAPSDTCEVHAGEYRQAGAVCDENCATELDGTLGQCDKQDCWYSMVFASGHGPNLSGNGYGTAAQPGYLRGAFMNASTDTWDADQDKVPDTEPGEPKSYRVVFHGDLDGDGAFTATTSVDSTYGPLSGDAFYAMIWGCGNGDFGNPFCRGTGQPPGGNGVRVDTNGDGLFDLEITAGIRNVDHLVLQDIEFTGLNGGNGATSGIRAKEGSFHMQGDGATDGIRINHIYVHGNDYSLSSPAGTENHWTMFADQRNDGCGDYTEIANSYLEQNNEKLLNSDVQLSSTGGCSIYFHDNRVVINITSDRVDTRNGHFMYLKPVDDIGGRSKQIRIWNNEIIWLDGGRNYTMAIGDFGSGKSNGAPYGQLWIYGNIFRNDPAVTVKPLRFWNGNCDGNGSSKLSYYFFNNTFDVSFNSNSNGIWKLCGQAPDVLVEKNNVYWNSSTPVNPNNDDGVVKEVHSNEICSFTCSTGCDENHCFRPSGTNLRTDWWTWTPPTLHTGLSAYQVKPGGPLDNAGSCDPDGDGSPGVDYDGDGLNDTTWTDLTGNTVDCTSLSNPIHAGAIQAAVISTPPDMPTLTVGSVSHFSAVLTGSAFNDPDPEDQHAASQFQVSKADDAFTVITADSGILTGAIVQWTVSPPLLPSTAYLSRVRYQDSRGTWSEWSASTESPFITLADTDPPEDVRSLRRTDSY